MNKENKTVMLHVRVTKTQFDNFRSKLNGKSMSEIIRNFVVTYNLVKENA